MSRTKRRLLLFAAVCTMTTFQVVPFTPNSCASYGLYAGLASFDFCGVVNCTGGSFFNFCNPVQLFVDCP